eukprot:7357589-Ditylum_brightwellii.AAC.1
MHFFTATGGEKWGNNEGWMDETVPHCNWHGITCNYEGYVYWIGLSDNQLIGSIPSEVGLLSGLTFLYLENNQLTGSIPSVVGLLSHLGELYLRNNQLIGSIPSEVGLLSELTFLYLDNNQLTGSIPSG